MGKRYSEGSEALSLRPKSGIISINAGNYRLLETKISGELTHVQLLTTPEVPNSFWIRPCQPKDIGAKKLNGTGKDISCTIFFKTIRLPTEETTLVPTSWDFENDALRVDLPTP